MLVNFPIESLQDQEKALFLHPKLHSLDRIAVIVLGGGEGKRLEPLTKTRCKPALTFGGRYTLIDIPISHSLTSGLSTIFVIGQYMAYTLQKHLFKTYFSNGILQKQIQLLVPEERDGTKIWYKGTADAIRQNLNYFSEIPADYFLILSGDQLYNINFLPLIYFGLEVDAGMVIAAKPVAEKEARRMGILKLEHGSSKIVDFQEKPQDKETLERFYTDEFTLARLGYDNHNGRNYLGSMGIYFFKKQSLFDLLQEDTREDFGKHLIKTQMKKGDVHAYLYDGYWEDIGTIESYYYANLALTQPNFDRKLGLQCYLDRDTIFSKHYNLPGAKIGSCKILRSLVCEGSIIDAKEISDSVIGIRSLIGRGSVIKNSVLIGNEYYEKPTISPNESPQKPGIGQECLIEKAIVDENVTIGDRSALVNQKGYVDYDSPDGLVVVRDGIIIVPRGTQIPENYIF